ncbi:hypothetical protein C7N83_01225 [Neisseria iguanae]|uniref:Mobilization protein n=2 Tax=Neisseria iguanae TaxID=90242 RepID=A0A2P7U2X8_9NEIS|nr:hypothetical protein C7N83_01225 [Neisseria iguanae]
MVFITPCRIERRPDKADYRQQVGEQVETLHFSLFLRRSEMKQENDTLVRLKANIDAKLRHAVEYRRDQEEREMLERMISQGVIPQDDYSKEERKLLVKAFFASIFGQKQVSIEGATQEVEAVLREILKARG